MSLRPLSGRSQSMEGLDQPNLPWMQSEQRMSVNSLARSSVESTGSVLYTVKRNIPTPSFNKKRRRWTNYKWWLLFANTILFCYGLALTLFGILTFLKLYLRADVIIVGESPILNVILATGVICLLAAIFGYVGIMLNNRTVLTLYNLFLWLCFAMIAAIGYMAYRRNKWNIEGKLSNQWHHEFSAADRERIQADLHCCGYSSFSDYHESSNKCFPRTLLPGCKFKYQQFTIQVLTIIYIVAFAIVPAHIFVLFSALLCANHINRKFGKGLPPKLYWLDHQHEHGMMAGTPTASTVNLHTMGLQRRRV